MLPSFLKVNPNEKIPALLDKKGPGGEEVTVMESAAIMMYLMENYAPDSPLLPKDPVERSKVLQWLFWQMGTAPYFGQFGHFFKYYKEKLEYPIARYTMESKFRPLLFQADDRELSLFLSCIGCKSRFYFFSCCSNVLAFSF